MNNIDIDPIETKEWLDSFKIVSSIDGEDRAQFILNKLIEIAHVESLNLPTGISTPYLNTISKEQEIATNINTDLEKKISAAIRWNAMVMVVRANQKAPELGGHIASYASSATLYDIGFNHFYRGANSEQGADLVFFQGHISPGIYARAYLEGRISESQMLNFRQEANKDGLSSYPHPYLMPNFWQFPTVSMGLGPIMSIYQARFMKYLQHRNIKQTDKRKVWAYLGDGETDEPESLGAISFAGREKLDNLIFVINCNLQRLDGPVRGNGKIIQELESMFRGANWNVIKVIWGSSWDNLLAKDTKGLLKQRMAEVVDGEYQAYKAKDGAYVREHFFGKYPELLAMVEHLSDKDIYALKRGGHDPIKVYQAYKKAVTHVGQPTVILVKTVKGYGMGESGEGKMTTHSQKKLAVEHVIKFAKRFKVPISSKQAENLEFYKPDDNSEEIKYLQQKRLELGGYLPERKFILEKIIAPKLAEFSQILVGTGDKKVSTTQIFVRILTLLTRNKNINDRIVPIVADEARTFGMEGLFRSLGIYSSSGQLYEPEDHDKVMWYKEDVKGQVLQEGISEAGAISDWIAAATSYATHNKIMIPFYIYYSKFGFQRVGDLIWAAGDMQAKGFLLGGTSGRTPLSGEGLQHQDGDSHILANTIPNCKTYDPTYGYELAIIICDGINKMYVQNHNYFYYITLMNEGYEHCAMPEKSTIAEGIIRGIYKLLSEDKAQINLLGSGVILTEVIKAKKMLKNDFNITANVYSVTSFNELTREAQNIDRDNLLNNTNKVPYITKVLDNNLPSIAATDYMRNYAESIRKYVPQRYETMGTDGFGRSDTRAELRNFFEIDARYICLCAVKTLIDEDKISTKIFNKVIKKYSIDNNKANPMA